MRLELGNHMADRPRETGGLRMADDRRGRRDDVLVKGIIAASVAFVAMTFVATPTCWSAPSRKSTGHIAELAGPANRVEWSRWRSKRSCAGIVLGRVTPLNLLLEQHVHERPNEVRIELGASAI